MDRGASRRDPLVSVVVPMYDEAASVREAMRSLLAQSYSPVEVIAVDDGSTDRTAAIVREYAERYDRVRLLENRTNVGQTFARNRGAMVADGKYLVFHDADDVSTPDRIQKQVAFMERNPAVGVVGSGYFYCNELRGERTVRTRPTDDATIRHNLAREPMVNLGTSMYRWTALAETGLFEAPQLEGYDLLVRLAADHELANLPEPLYVYRVDDGSSSRRDEGRKKLGLVRQGVEAARTLGVGHRNLLLTPGWLAYMYLPTRAKAAVRRVFSPTDNDDITGSDATKLDRTLAVARGETVQFLDDGTPDGAELEPLSSGD
jgi:glycosyltransferase involved in cell wall biosynthesis